MPVMFVCSSTDCDIIDPHVQIRPIEYDEKDSAGQSSDSSCSWKDKEEADNNFGDTADPYPEPWPAKNIGDYRFKPYWISKVLDSDVDEPDSEDSPQSDFDPIPHGYASEHECNRSDSVPRVGFEAGSDMMRFSSWAYDA